MQRVHNLSSRVRVPHVSNPSPRVQMFQVRVRIRVPRSENFSKLTRGRSTSLANFVLHKTELDYFWNNNCTRTRHYYYNTDYNKFVIKSLFIFKIILIYLQNYY